MAKYGKKAQSIIQATMEEYGDGKLKSSSGDKVKSRDQALAIGISKARQAGTKVPKEPKQKQ